MDAGTVIAQRRPVVDEVDEEIDGPVVFFLRSPRKSQRRSSLGLVAKY